MLMRLSLSNICEPYRDLSATITLFSLTRRTVERIVARSHENRLWIFFSSLDDYFCSIFIQLSGIRWRKDWINKTIEMTHNEALVYGSLVNPLMMVHLIRVPDLNSLFTLSVYWRHHRLLLKKAKKNWKIVVIFIHRYFVKNLYSLGFRKLLLCCAFVRDGWERT